MYLFKKAVNILDEANISRDDWTFGGGTSLAMRYNHRESYDIDIFIPDTQILLFLTPRLNPGINTDYSESSNHIKLIFPEGEIDFIAAPYLTNNYFMKQTIEGQKIRVETPTEVIIKKLFYRAESLKIRDIIDTAVVSEDPEVNLLAEADILKHKLEVLKWRWKNIKPYYNIEVEQLRGLNTSLKNNAPKIFDKFLNQISLNQINPKGTKRPSL